MKIFSRIFPLTTSLLVGASAQDTNSNGLNDLWEQRFKLSGMTMNRNHDLDGDGVSNAKEAMAGTDPLNRKSYLRMNSSLFGEDKSNPTFTFDTVEGKLYQLEIADSSSGFRPTGSVWWGDGHTRSLKISEQGGVESARPIRADFWRTEGGTSMTNLTGLATFPNSPDGSIHLGQPANPRFLSGKYGARLEMWITPPETGEYVFFLSSQGPSELYFRPSVDAGSISRIAEIPTEEKGVGVSQWHTQNGGTTSPISLEAGKRYYLQLRYVVQGQSQHCHIGWSGPGLNGIEKLRRKSIAKSLTPPSSQASGSYYRDYDSDGQTKKMWAADSTLEDTVANMPYLEERIKFQGNQGDTTLMRAIFPNRTNTLYATWLFNMAGGADSHDYISLFLGNKQTGNSEEGPRVNFRGLANASQATISAGASTGTQRSFSVNSDQTYRVEIIATISDGGFSYETPSGSSKTAKNTFDMFLSKPDGTLVGSARGLSFRDGNLVTGFGEIATKLVNNPNIAFDSWEFTGGEIAGSGYIASNTSAGADGSKLYRISVQDQDQDQDGLSDSDEMLLSKYHRVLFFDPQATTGTADEQTAVRLVNRSSGKPKFSLVATDVAAFERNSPLPGVDNATIQVSRSGSIEPVTLKLCIAPMESTGATASECDGTCCKLIGSAGDEPAEQSDYIITDSDGNVVTDEIHFAFGEVKKILTVTAIPDDEYEYPETLNVAIEKPTDGSFELGSNNGASIQLFDLPEHPQNSMFFTGRFSQDGRALMKTTASGYTTATINGPRTKIEIWAEFSGLSSPQNNAHVHKSEPGRAPGMVAYGITETPGDPSSSPLGGAISAYPWDLTQSSGLVSSVGRPTGKQVIIDSLFNQAGETPLYFNVHTDNNPGGEIWAFYSASAGSKQDPGKADPPSPPGSQGFPQLTGIDLEREVRRFLNQATFGARDIHVETLLKKIEDERKTNPSYHRKEAFEDWIDTQMDPVKTPQTYYHDLLYAQHFQALDLAGVWNTRKVRDPITYPPVEEPSSYPFVVRPADKPDYWYLSELHPMSYIPSNKQLGLAQGEDSYYKHIGVNIGHYGFQDVVTSLYQLMVNGRDQLRHKMGFALSQICVVSMSDFWLWDNSNGMANYWDQINIRAFSNYRDVLSFANKSPVMGWWLSSIKNQKAVDVDKDGEFDIFPDENLARENMQLFSIGLFEQWSDGSLVLGSDGLPIPTYDNDDIKEFAKILTGQAHGVHGKGAYGGKVPPPTDSFTRKHVTMGLDNRSFLYPMIFFKEEHQPGKKTFAGVTIDNSHLTPRSDRLLGISSRAEGNKDLEDAMDWLAGVPGDGKADYNMVNSHRSTPAFISRILIQRFTTSNPSREYLHRVATVFKDTAGDLGKVVKAILLDPEARNIDLTNSKFGIKKSPVESLLQLIRTLEGYTGLPLTEVEENDPLYGEYSEHTKTPDAPSYLSKAKTYLTTYGYPQAQIDAQERNVRLRPPNNGSQANPTPHDGLSMDLGWAETVFNFYSPDYSKHGVISESNLVSPELQLATEPEAVKNLNVFYDLIYRDFKDDKARPGAPVGFTKSWEFFNTPPAYHIWFVRLRLPLQKLADELYPSRAPTATGTRTSESLADQQLVDALDLMLCNGMLKKQYRYSNNDDDDPSVPGADDLLKNPREIIIDMVTDGNTSAFSGTAAQKKSRRLNKLQDALYLLITSAEFQVKK